MGTFAEIIDEAMKRKGWGYNRLSVEIGVLPSGGIFNPTQIRRLRLGERKHMSPELLERLIEVLDLPEDEAYHAAGLWPPGLNLEEYRRFRHLAATSANGVIARKVAILPVDDGLDDQIRRLRPPRPRVERRLRDRRRLRLVPEKVAA